MSEALQLNFELRRTISTLMTRRNWDNLFSSCSLSKSTPRHVLRYCGLFISLSSCAINNFVEINWRISFIERKPEDEKPRMEGQFQRLNWACLVLEYKASGIVLRHIVWLQTIILFNSRFYVCVVSAIRVRNWSFTAYVFQFQAHRMEI